MYFSSRFEQATMKLSLGLSNLTKYEVWGKKLIHISFNLISKLISLLIGYQSSTDLLKRSS